MQTANNPARPLKERILLLIGFGFALLGYLNAVPDLGPLPSLGVIPAVQLHPLVFAVGLFISFLVISKFTGSPRELLKTALNAALLIIGFYALISFNIAVTRTEEVGLFFFQDFHAWMTVIGCSIILYF